MVRLALASILIAGCGDVGQSASAEASADAGGASTGGTSVGSGTESGPSTGETDSVTGSSTGAEDPVDRAIEQGIQGTLALSVDQPVVLLLMDVMHRRFAVDAFAHAASAYDETLEGQDPALVDPRAFRRVFDPGQTLTAAEIAMVAEGVNRITVPALFCDQVPVDTSYAAFVADQAALGGYELTHVALALSWGQQLGCDLGQDATFSSEVVESTRALIDPVDGLTDLEVEAAVFASYFAPVDEEVVTATVDGQLPDGTWPRNPGEMQGNPHTTALAVLLLHEAHREAVGPFLAAR